MVSELLLEASAVYRFITVFLSGEDLVLAPFLSQLLIWYALRPLAHSVLLLREKTYAKRITVLKGKINNPKPT